MDEAHRHGFRIHLVYVNVDNVQVLLDRIAGRVLEGGHAVPESDVRRRYVRSLRHLAAAVARVDHVMVLNNVLEQEPRLVMMIDGGQRMLHVDEVPSWVVMALSLTL